MDWFQWAFPLIQNAWKGEILKILHHPSTHSERLLDVGICLQNSTAVMQNVTFQFILVIYYLYLLSQTALLIC